MKYNVGDRVFYLGKYYYVIVITNNGDGTYLYGLSSLMNGIIELYVPSTMLNVGSSNQDTGSYSSHTSSSGDNKPSILTPMTSSTSPSSSPATIDATSISTPSPITPSLSTAPEVSYQSLNKNYDKNKIEELSNNSFNLNPSSPKTGEIRKIDHNDVFQNPMTPSYVANVCNVSRNYEHRTQAVAYEMQLESPNGEIISPLDWAMMQCKH